MMWMISSVVLVLMLAALVWASERVVRAALLVGALLSLGLMVQGHLSSPGFEVAWLLLFGVLLAGAFPGAGVKGALIPAALFVPLVFAMDGTGRWASHSHWSTAAYVVLGAGVSLAFRALAVSVAGADDRAGRLRLLGVTLVSPLVLLTALVPAKGALAWNVLLPMASSEGVLARVVVLSDTGADAWPWLEPIAWALPVAVATMAMVGMYGVLQRTLRPRGQAIACVLALVALVGWVAVLWLTPGVRVPLEDVDAAQVLASARPSWVAASSVTYLAPETSLWSFALAPVLLWLGVGASMAVGLVVAQSAPSETPQDEVLPGMGFVNAGVLVLVAGLFLAESWVMQASSTLAQTGVQGLWFANAALLGAGAFLRGGLGAWVRALSVAVLMGCVVLWLVARVGA